MQEYRKQVCEESRAVSKQPYTPNIFKGKVFCADCGRSLHRQREKRKKGPDVYHFHCLTNSRVQQKGCKGVRMPETELIATVTSILEKELAVALGMSLPLFQLEARQKQEKDKLKAQMSTQRQEIEKKRLLIQGLYENFVQGILTGEEEEFWGIVGLLHDLDFEQFPEEHCIKSQEIMRERGIDEKIVRATASHGYAITVDIKPEHEMEKVLYAVDELTGLIGAVVLMRPSKSVQDLQLKSVKKKYKSKGFAAGCSREVIERGAEMLGWTLDELIQRTIDALKTFQE